MNVREFCSKSCAVVVGIPMRIPEFVLHGFERARRGAKRILVRVEANEPAVLGQAASLGCWRVAPQLAHRLRHEVKKSAHRVPEWSVPDGNIVPNASFPRRSRILNAALPST